MGVSDLADCLAKYKRTEGGKEVLSDCVVLAVCADGNAEDNWSTPPAGGWGFYDVPGSFGHKVACPTDGFCPDHGDDGGSY